MSPTMFDELSSEDPWTRALALNRITEKDLADPKLFIKVLSMLMDKGEPSPPDRPLDDEGAKVAFLFNKDFTSMEKEEVAKAGKRDDEEVEEEEFPDEYDECSEEEAVEEAPYLYYLRELAANVLPRGFKNGTEEILEALVAMTGPEMEYELLDWLDSNFLRFEWHDKEDAIKRYSKAVVENCVYSVLNVIIRRAGSSMIGWFTSLATQVSPADNSVLRRIHDIYGEEGTTAVMDSLEGAKGPLGSDIIGTLSKICQMKALQERALALLIRVEEEGHPQAAGYLAIYRPNAIPRLKLWLANRPEKTDETNYQFQLTSLLDRVMDFTPVKGYPYLELLSHFDADRTLRLLRRWRQVESYELEKDLLWNAVSLTRNNNEVYDAFIELGERGHLKDDKEGSRKLWVSMKEWLEEQRLSLRKLTTKAELQCDYVNKVDSTIIRMSKEAVRPFGYEEAMVDLLKDKYVKPSIIADTLPGWDPKGEAKATITQAIKDEVEYAEKVWELEQEERKKGQGDYQRYGMKGFQSILMDLEKRWKSMHDLSIRIGGIEDVIKRMEVLYVIKWPERIWLSKRATKKGP